jgi:hypothetical protein
MSEGSAANDRIETTPPTREPWVRPTVTKMDAGDAELNTRPTTPDGAFSVS